MLLTVVLVTVHLQLRARAVAAAVDSALRESAVAADNCRKVVFSARGQGGMMELKPQVVKDFCADPKVDGACEELQDFTGLTDEEFAKRIERRGHFHFEGEHRFWNPGSETELAWYYATSVDYLFGNVVHSVATDVLDSFLEREKHEPVLEYSGGTGNNAVFLAKKRGLRVQYFGIGMAEKTFVRYRVERNGLQDLVEFKDPYAQRTGYTFDPINGPLPRDGSLGSVLAMDVLEHIPDYHRVVEAMVDSIRVGGRIIENSPFAKEEKSSDQEDLRVHVSTGGVSMQEAMGPRMKKIDAAGVWEKISE